MKKEIICAGEVLYDLISQETGKSIGETLKFEKRIGGSPFNICCGLARLGEAVSFFSQIADDSFGKSIRSYLQGVGVDMKNTTVKTGSKTSLAFAAVDENGKADYEFYREGAADCTVEMAAADAVDLDNCSIFHFGSLAIVDEPGNAAYTKLFERALDKGVLTSFDPNVRAFYIKDKEKYVNSVMEIVQKTDILKLSDEDLFYLTGFPTVELALRKLPKKEGRLDFVTMGKSGCIFHKDGQVGYVGGYIVDVADTVGCGDSFMAAVLKIINQRERQIKYNDFKLMEEAARFATACSAIVATRRGADTIPSVEEVEAFRATIMD